jgi:hypothetical protein
LAIRDVVVVVVVVARDRVVGRRRRHAVVAVVVVGGGGGGARKEKECAVSARSRPTMANAREHAAARADVAIYNNMKEAKE